MNYLFYKIKPGMLKIVKKVLMYKNIKILN